MAYDEIKDTDDFETYEKRLFSQTSLQQKELPREVSSVPTQLNSKSAADSSMDIELVVEGSSNSKIVNSVEQSLIQLQKEQVSIPACTSLGCKTESIAKPPGINYPVDYKVPNFGQDTDIVDSIKNEKDSSAKLGGKLAQSRPACTSVKGSCKTGTAAAPNLDTKTVFNLPAGSVVNDVDGGPPGPVGPPFPQAINVLLEEMSRPACTSVKGSCKTGTAAAPNLDTKTVFNLPAGSVVNDVDGGPPGPVGPPFPQAINVLLEQMSVPACTSLGCKKGSAAMPPTDTTPLTDNWGKIDSDWGIYHAKNYADLVQRQSVPACTSIGCKKESMAYPPDYDTTDSNWGKSDEHWQPRDAPSVNEKNLASLYQRKSVPACTSIGCKKESMAYPPDYDTTDSNWGKSDEHWQPRDAPSVNEKNLASLYQRY